MWAAVACAYVAVADLGSYNSSPKFVVVVAAAAAAVGAAGADRIAFGGCMEAFL